MRRLYSASDVRRYARCPRQWWYETRQAELASLSAEEIERRLTALRRRYGARAEETTAYQLLDDLAARQRQLARGRHVHAAHARRALHPGLGCLPALLAAGVVGALIMALHSE